MTYCVRESWIQDIYLAQINYRSLSKLFRQIIKFRLDQVMVTNNLLLNPQPESQEFTRRNKNFLFMSNAGPAEGHCLAQSLKDTHNKDSILTSISPTQEKETWQIVQRPLMVPWCFCSHFIDQRKSPLNSEDMEKCTLLMCQKERTGNL